MEVSTFEEIQSEFMRRISQAVYCSMATVDRQGRPRWRILHPIWDSPIGWAISWKDSHKSKHLQNNPYVSLAYIYDREKPAYANCRAAWIESDEEKLRIWDLHKHTPPPLGFDPEPHYGNIHHKYFDVLKFTPWRIELANLNGEPMIWRSEELP